MKKFTSIILLMLAFVWMKPIAAQGQYKVVRGERPPVDYSKLTADSYVKGVLKIKFADNISRGYNDLKAKVNEAGTVEFGIASVDALNARFQASSVVQDYAAISVGSKYEQRHIAWGFHLWYTLHVDESSDMFSLAAAYEALPEIAVAEPEFKKELIGTVTPYDPATDAVQADGDKTANWVPNDPRYTDQWHYNNTGANGGTPDADIDLPEAWEMETGDTNVIVAVIDQGIQFNHVDLAANMWSGNGWNFVTNSSNITPGDHGCHTSGTIGAVTNNSIGVSGVAGGTGTGNGVRLMSCQVFSNSGSGGFAQAPIWAADRGAAISQNSWGYTNMGAYNQDVLDAIDYFSINGGGDAMVGGGITIFSAGNSNSDGAWYPGYYSVTMAVAATNNQDKKAWYSNYGTWVDISAPGGETNSVKGVLSCMTNNGYGYMEGTSMACPHVSGVAALIVSKAYGTMTPDQVWDALVNTVDDHYGVNPGFIGKLGSGRLNAANALASLKDIQTPTNLTAVVDQATGMATLNWVHNQGNGFQYYKIYRDGEFIDNTVAKTFQDQLTDYGYYTYEVTAYYGGTDESDSAVKTTQYGSANMVLSNDTLTHEQYLEQTVTEDFIIWNTGVLPLDYRLSTFGLTNQVGELNSGSWFNYEPTEGTVAVGDSAIVVLTYNSTGLDLGTYSKNFIVRSNDLNNAVKSIPVTMNVVERHPLQITVSISETEVCVGETVQLGVEAIDGSGNYTFSWTSMPEGFVSFEQNPQVIPTVTTTYYVTVSDGEDELTGEVSVTVYPYPVVDLGVDQAYCGEEAVTLDAGNEGMTYLWSTGATTQSINVTQAEFGFGSHEFWVAVSGPIGCASGDTVAVKYSAFPPVAVLDRDTLLCGSEHWEIVPSETAFAMLWSNGATTNTITVDTVGIGYGVQTYYVDLTSEDGCTTRSGEVAIEFVDCTGLLENNAAMTINVYPNPASSAFELIVGSQSQADARMQLFNAFGNLVAELTLKANQKQLVNINGQAAGVYTLVVRQGTNVSTHKLIIR